MKIKKFTFNPFQENTYILYNKNKDAIIVDPGCFDQSEENELLKFVEENGLIPIRVINTHAHIDHVLGNQFVVNQFNIELSLFQSEYPMLEMAKTSAELYGVPYKESPEPHSFLKEGDQLVFGETTLKILFVPGHAPDHIVLLNEKDKTLIGGDVLFKGSIGRTDLPGGNHEQLLKNIKEKIFTLDESITVYSGHGEETTIGFEKRNNPFFTAV